MTPVEMLGLTEFPRIGDLPYFLTLAPYAFVLVPPAAVAGADRGAARAGNRARRQIALPRLFMGAAWDTLLDGNVRTLIEREALAPFLQRQRWFGGKARRIRTARFVDWGSCGAAAGRCFSRSSR